MTAGAASHAGDGAGRESDRALARREYLSATQCSPQPACARLRGTGAIAHATYAVLNVLKI